MGRELWKLRATQLEMDTRGPIPGRCCDDRQCHMLLQQGPVSLFFSVHTVIYKQPSTYKQATTPGTQILLVREQIKSEISSAQPWVC